MHNLSTISLVPNPTYSSGRCTICGKAQEAFVIKNVSYDVSYQYRFASCTVPSYLLGTEIRSSLGHYFGPISVFWVDSS
jgi:hypothetical protein